MSGWLDNIFTDNLQKLATGFIELLYPPRCHVCGGGLPSAREGAICSVCMGQVSFIRSPLCPRCGKQMSRVAGVQDHHCGECLKMAPPFDSARSLVHYKPPVKALLHRLKYRGDTTVARPLAMLMKNNAQIWHSPHCDYIIPVPLFVARLRGRGLNQAQVLAALAFPAQKEKIATNLLVRVKNTTSQTGLNGVERRKNLRGAFAVRVAAQLRNRHLWLVDDVFTTGTTVAECARTLKKAGASSVHVWTFARV